MIKHLVLSGGGPTMIQMLSAIQYLEKNDFIDIKNIETIYGTSAGAIIGTLIALKFDWETMNDYIIKRPWQDVFPIKIDNIFSAYSKKGIFDSTTVEKCFKPLFDAKDIPIDINLEDFYKLSNIELHMFSFEINDYKIYDISYLTHPKLLLITAIHMTSALPILLTPVCIDDKCYIDGGMVCNYPLNYCIESGKKTNEILGIKSKYGNNKSIINTESSILDFLMGFLYKAVFSINIDDLQPKINNEIYCDAQHLSIDVLKSALYEMETRKKLFNNGTEIAEQFLINIIKQ